MGTTPIPTLSRPLQGRAAGRGRAPNFRRPSQRREVPPPPGQPPASHAARQAQQGTKAEELGPGPHACTHTATACGQQTLSVCPKDGQLAEDEHLTSDAPHKGARQPLRGHPTARNAASREPALRGRCRVPTPATPTPRKHGQRPPTTCPEDRQLGKGERLTPDAPSNDERCPPPGQPPARGALGEVEHLTSDAPHEGAKCPFRRRLPASPTACNASSQERALWGQCYAHIPTAPTHTIYRQRAPATRPWGEGEPVTRDASHLGRMPPPPRHRQGHPPRRTAPGRACQQKG